MATPHLCQTTRNASKNLLSEGSHLLIVRRRTAWSNKEIVAVPTDEKFVCASAWGIPTSYGSIVTSQLLADGNVVVADLQAKLDATTSWTSGHKNIYGYHARSGCPMWTCTGSPTLQQKQRALEVGVSRVQMTFDAFAFPIGNSTSFHAYLRFKCPSWLQWTDGGVFGFSSSHNGTASIDFCLTDSAIRPNEFEGQEVFSCDFSQNGFANKGNLSSSGAPCGSGTYAPFDRSGVTQYYGHIAYYYDGTTSAWTNDYELTGGALAKLKELVGSRRKIYLTASPRIANGLATQGQTYGMAVGSTATVMTRGIELVFKVSGNRINMT